MTEPFHKWADGHQGGRFDADTTHRIKMLKGNLSLTGLLGVTEGVGLPKIEGYGRKGHECKVYFDLETWEYKDHDVESVRTATWHRGTSRRKTVEFEWTFLENADGWTLLRIIAHLPAHLFLPGAARANAEALRELSAIVKRLEKELNPDEIDLSMDLNRDLRLERNVELVERSLKGTSMHIIMPPEGTLKKRKIDLLASSASHRDKAKMYHDWSQYDHTGFYANLAA